MRPPFHTFVHLLLIGLLLVGAWRTPCTGKAMSGWATTGETASPSSDSPCPMHAALREAVDNDARPCDHANGTSCHCGIAQAALPCDGFATPAPRRFAMPTATSPETPPNGLIQRLLRPPIRIG